MTENMLEFFRGFVPTKNKRCMLPFKDKTPAQLMSLEQVRNFSEFAGVLAEDAVLLDFDDEAQADKALAIVRALGLRCAVNQTGRGKHIFLKNHTLQHNKTHTALAVGLSADIKVGSKTSYAILKYDGEERATVLDTCDADGYDDVPRYFFPVRASLDFVHMGEGDGRNQALFNYILTLQASDFATEEARETLRLLNEYVLACPLPPDELETILRDEAFKKPIFFNGSTFLFNKFATFLKNNDHVIKINNQLHIYRGGVYVCGKQAIESAMIAHIPTLSKARRTEVLEYLNIFIYENTPTDAHLIAFQNGLYNILDGSFLDFHPSHVVTNKIKWQYNPHAYSRELDTMLERVTCGDAEIRQIVEEMVGYCFYRKNELRKAFILTGDGSNGKSTFLAVLQTLLGEDNIASLDLKELGDRFKTAEMFGKLANIGDDIGDEFIANPAIFKKLTTGERVSVEQKGRDPFEFNNFSKLIFSANDIPRIKDKTGAVVDRLVIVPFHAKFTIQTKGYQQNIRAELTRSADAMEYLILLGLAGLRRILKAQQFTQSQKVLDEVEAYQLSNNPVLSFFRELEDEATAIENEPTGLLYKRYQGYCICNNLQPLSAGEFTKQVKKFFGFIVKDARVQGKKCRIFVKE